MKQNYSTTTIILFFLTFFMFNLCNKNTFADEYTSVQEYEIEFSKTTLTLKEALQELNQIPEITVVYGNIDKLLNIKITFSAKKLTVKKAISEIENFAPVDLRFNNKHIVVKEKEIKDSYLLNGVVKDALTNERMPTAYIYIKGTQTGTVTDQNGNFTMHLPPGSYQLVCRYIGYGVMSKEIDLYQDKELNFLLQVQEHEISEVNVQGSYTELENLERGRPIETIDSKTIERLNTNDVNDALHGSLKGVWTAKVSGAPGDHHRIRIRGINSIFGCSDPLYVVDGSIIPIVNFDNIGISDLNSHDIDKITVLKDASSTVL